MVNTFTLTDPKNGQTIEYQLAPISTFWRRIFAMFSDWLILGIIGFTLGLFFNKQFVLMGSYGRLIGFVITLLYFGFLNSCFGNGQSFGKRFLKIRVVNKEGSYISIARSLFRSLVLIMPFFLNGIVLSPSSVSKWIMVLLPVAVFGIGSSIIYLYIFNRNSRQSIHDLLSKTYVVRGDLKGPVYTEPISKVHYSIIIIIFLGALVLPFILNNNVPNDLIGRINTIQGEINKSTGLFNTLIEGVICDSKKPKKYVQVSVDIDNLTNRKDIVKNIVETLLNVNVYRKKDYIGIVMNYGYNIGIWSQYSRQNYWYTPQEWADKFNLKLPK